MPKCKGCGSLFVSENRTAEICPLCEKALKRLSGYAVPVVHCKDCKFWVRDGGGYSDDESHCDNPDGLDNYAYSYDFCSYGERRNNE